MSCNFRKAQMMKLTDIVEIKVGTVQFRIKESSLAEAPVYKIFSQSDLEEDLAGIEVAVDQPKEVKTQEHVATLATGDVVFSLISGKATIVSELHDGYLYTQNYAVLKGGSQIDSQYLVYFLNEDTEVARQFWQSLQGSVITKFTLKQLRELKISALPSLAQQKLIGQIYIKQHQMQALKERVARNETQLQLAKLKIANQRSKEAGLKSEQFDSKGMSK